MSHTVQCEPDWKDVADDILAWIGSPALGERNRLAGNRWSGQRPQRAVSAASPRAASGRVSPFQDVRFLPPRASSARASC